MTVQRIKDTGNLISYSIESNRAVVKVEINNVSKVTGNQISYELADGSHMEILSLIADQFINEKILAYSDRRFIRDIYDIYYISTNYELLDPTLKSLAEFIADLEPPVDEQVLKTLVYAGIPPKFENMVAEIKRHIR